MNVRVFRFIPDHVRVSHEVLQLDLLVKVVLVRRIGNDSLLRTQLSGIHEVIIIVGEHDSRRHLKLLASIPNQVE